MRKPHAQTTNSGFLVPRVGAAVVLLLLASGCTTAALEFPSVGLERLGLAHGKAAPAPSKVVLSQRAGGLGEATELEAAVRDVVDLARQKRFGEARVLLGTVRSTQAGDSEGYQAASASMALLALREGDFAAFMRIAGRLDQSLGEPVRVDDTYAGVITLYRAVSGGALPVNAPDKLRRLDAPSKRAARTGS